MSLLISRVSPTFLSTASLQLRLNTWSSVAATIKCEGLLNNNTFSMEQTTASDNSKTTSTLNLGGEYPLSAVAYTETDLEATECFANMELWTTGNVKIATIGQSYINSLQDLTAYSSNDNPLDGQGRTFVKTIANPSAGEDWSYSVPSGVVQHLSQHFKNIFDVRQYVFFNITNSGAGGTTREAEIQIYDQDGGVTLWASSAGSGFSGSAGTGNLLFSQSYGVRGLVEKDVIF